MIVAAGGDTGGSGVMPAVVGGAGGPSGAGGRAGLRRRCCASCTPTSSPEGRRRTQTPRIVDPSASRLLFMIAGSTHTPSRDEQTQCGPAECRTYYALTPATIHADPSVARGKAGRLFAPRSAKHKNAAAAFRPSPSNSGWEHRRSRGDSHRAAASVFPRRESEVGVTRGIDVVRRGPAEAGH